MRKLTILLMFLRTFCHAAGSDWGTYLGSKTADHYSELKQITPENVNQLAVAWTYHSGGSATNNRSQIQCNPLVINGILYGTSADLQLFAVNATSGAEIWRFDPASVHGVTKTGVNRGLSWWSDGYSERLFYANDRFLHCIDPKTGIPVASFGEGGRVNLKADLGRDVSKLSQNLTSPGIVCGDLIVVGSRLGEGPAPAAPGHIRAYDVRTGRLAWRFHTIPQPGEFGHETWPPDAYRHIGGANVWAGFSLDEKRGIVFCPTGSAAFDFWGGNRVGDNLFANCLIALDVKTGERIWHQQLVRHDLWDRDLPAPPTLLTVRRNGRAIDAVAQVTKSGHVFVFERETGTPLFPLMEVHVPQSDLHGETAAATQRIPQKPEPFSRQIFSYNEITDLSAESHKQVLERFFKLRPHTLFAPPAREGTIIFPGFDGGAEWGGAAADPDGILYVNANEMAWVLTMVEAKRSTAADGSASGAAIYSQICAACHGQDRSGNAAQNVPSLAGLEQRMKRRDIMSLLQTGKGLMPSFGFLSEKQQEAVADFILGLDVPTPSPVSQEPRPPSGGDTVGLIPYSTTGYHRWLDPSGYPALKPPWGTLNAIDLNSGEYLWRSNLGEYPELTARGVPPTGTENYGGPVVTAGGLVFIAASRDEHLRAFDSRSGRELWRARLPAAGYATPATYAVAGRQYVVIACGGGKCGTKSGDAYVAFALPGDNGSPN